MLVNAAALDRSAPQFTIEGVLPRVGLGIWWGPSHIGKSLVVAGEMCLAVANEKPFFGHPVIQGNVVLALGEGSYDAGVRMETRIAREHRDRAAAGQDPAVRGSRTLEEYLASLPPYTDERVFVETDPFTVTVARGGRPDASLTGAVDRWGQIPDLEMVILDALPDFSGGESITNDTMATRFVMGLKYMVASLDCLVMCVHHATARGDKMIGGIRLFNAADFVAHLAADDTEPGAPEGATITCEKSKYGEKFEPISYTVVKHEWWEPATGEGGELTGGDPVRVTSATVRPVTGDSETEAGPGAPSLVIPPPPGTPDEDRRRPAPRLVLPDLADVTPRRRKRSGLRALTPAVMPPETDADDRAALVTSLLSVPCPACTAAADTGCSREHPAEMIRLDRFPPLAIHSDRAQAAIAAGAVSQEVFQAQFEPGTAPAILTGARA